VDVHRGTRAQHTSRNATPRKLREFGVNFVRCSHYSHGRRLLRRVRQRGKSSCGWKCPHGICCISAPMLDSTWIARCANESAVHGAANGRNHPSVMIWGAGLNEGIKLAAFDTPQNNLCLSEDSTRPTTAARPPGHHAPTHLYILRPNHYLRFVQIEEESLHLHVANRREDSPDKQLRTYAQTDYHTGHPPPLEQLFHYAPTLQRQISSSITPHACPLW